MTVKPWYQMSIDEVLQALESSRRGLSSTEANRRLKKHGQNLLKEEDRKGFWPILIRQFGDVMILILLVAAAIAWAMDDLTDTIMILVIVILNASLGFSQEYRAERALGALRKLEQPQVVVRRDENLVQIPALELVPGDIVAMEEGQRVSADGRLIEATRLKVDESHLTGESVPVNKHIRALHGKEVPLGDRTNLVFMGTTVMTGHAWAVVTETGMRTELGKIAHLLKTMEDRWTPLQIRLAYLGKWLAVAAVLMTGLIFVAGLLQGEPLEVMLLTAISLAVAVIPEGLPAVVTIVLALGAQRMVRRNALIRKLPAVETLGSVTTICSDKTGTLTQNVMSVQVIYFGGRLLEVTGNGYKPDGNFYENGKVLDLHSEPALLELLRAAVLCTNARLQQHEGQWTILGDSTEGALLVAAAKANLLKDQLEGAYPRIAEIQFDSTRRLMTTVHQDATGRVWVFTKGSLEEILKRSTHLMEGAAVNSLTKHRHDEIVRINRELAGDGVRILACAMRELDKSRFPGDLNTQGPLRFSHPPGAEEVGEFFNDAERDLVFLGLFGMIDPPRPEVREAVARCKTAGIRPVMITGDHRITAEAIATNLGIKEPGDDTLTGVELESISVQQLASLAPKVSVYARVSPEHKVKIVQALKQLDEIVAMTGDGVNDAPSLRAADIGVAMGKGGTDVAREASDMVLLDDNFASIVSAVEEGRTIYDNIRKFTRYMLSTNSGEILTMFFAILFALPLPLLPIQILWINLVSDGLPALALGVEPPERDIMKRPPRYPKESLFASGLGLHIVWVGLLMGLGTIAVFAWAHQSLDLVHGQTMAFFILTIFQMFHVLAIRSERDPLWVIGLFSNSKLLGSVLLTVFLQLVIIYHPALQVVFHTTALTIEELVLCLVVSSTVYFAVEGEKWWRSRNHGQRHR